MKKTPKIVRTVQEHITEIKEGSKSISFSQLSQYVTCPYRWYRAYIKKEAPFVPSIHLIFGTAVHETIQEWLDKLYNVSVKDSELMDLNGTLLSKLKEQYKLSRDQYGQDFSTKAELAEFYQDGIAILDWLRKNRKSYFPTKGTWLVGCEIPIKVYLTETFYYQGYIDCLLYDEINNEWKIIDFKTATVSWGAETKSDFVKISQVLLYKHFLAEQFGIDIDTISTEYMVLKRKINENAEYPAARRRVQEVVPASGKVNIKKAISLVESFRQGALTETGEYQDREYEACPSEKNCKWCIFQDCPFNIMSQKR